MNDHLSKKLPDADSKASTIKPMLDAILARMNEGFAHLDNRFSEIDNRFVEMETRFAETDNRFAEVNGRLDSLEKRVNEGFEVMNQRFAAVNLRMDGFEKGLHEQNKLFKGLERRFDIFMIEVGKIKGGLYDHPVRIEELEHKAG